MRARRDGPEYGRTMIIRALVLAAAILAAVLVATASAAEPGAYSGTSVNKEIFRYGDVDPRTDKGKVTFKIKANTAKGLKLKGQQFMCGATTAEVPVAVGAFEVRLKVRDNGKATGTITPMGLCRGKVTFTAKHG